MQSTSSPTVEKKTEVQFEVQDVESRYPSSMYKPSTATEKKSDLSKYRKIRIPASYR